MQGVANTMRCRAAFGAVNLVEDQTVGEFAMAVAAGLVTTAVVKMIEMAWKFGKRGALMFPSIAKQH